MPRTLQPGRLRTFPVFFVSVSHVPIMLPVGGDGVGGDGRIIGTWRNSADPVRRPDYRNMGLFIIIRKQGVFFDLN